MHTMPRSPILSVLPPSLAPALIRRRSQLVPGVRESPVAENENCGRQRIHGSRRLHWWIWCAVRGICCPTRLGNTTSSAGRTATDEVPTFYFIFYLFIYSFIFVLASSTSALIFALQLCVFKDPSKSSFEHKSSSFATTETIEFSVSWGISAHVRKL